MIKWGIIGAGDVCEVKSAPAMNKIVGSKIQAVMRRNAQKAASYAERHGIEEWYSQAEKIFRHPDVNAFYIATPPGSHKDLTIRCSERGLPIYVEKPMALNHEECIAMLEACQKNKAPLYVAYYRRKLPSFLKVRSLVAENAIGDIRAVEVHVIKTAENDIIANSDENWRVNPDISGGGYFVDLASHQFDYLDYLFGPISYACGYKENQADLYRAEDIVVANFRFKSGILGTGMWCFTSAPEGEKEEIRIIGSKGVISFPCFGAAEVTLHLDGNTEVYSFENPAHIQQPLIATIVDEIYGRGTCPSTGITAARTNWVMDQILKG